MKRACLGFAATLLLVSACGGKPPEPAAAPGANPGGSSSAGSPAAPDTAPAAGTPPGDAGGASSPVGGQGAFAGRTGELVNPDNSTMVFLYYDLAGIPPPLENWVEEDSRVKYVPGVEKAPNRATVKAELESAAASVRGVGVIRLSMDANLSDYDPTYGEFMVRSLSPSQEVQFQAFGQKVSLRFANGRVAQTWKVPAAEAQAIRDKLGYARRVAMDVTLNITGVLPSPGGGAITTNVVEYEMRDDQSGAMIGRVQVPQ